VCVCVCVCVVCTFVNISGDVNTFVWGGDERERNGPMPTL
jgi:hypothetical protein